MNNLNIVEVTMVELADATHAVNKIVTDGSGIGRSHPYENLVVRVTDHVSDDNAEEDNADNMALFMSRKAGDNWIKDKNVLGTEIYAPTVGVTPTAPILTANEIVINQVRTY